jgi:hypothetical protein
LHVIRSCFNLTSNVDIALRNLNFKIFRGGTCPQIPLVNSCLRCSAGGRARKMCPFGVLPHHWRRILKKCTVSVCHIVLPASANGERMFHQMFLNLVGNIFAFREATFVSAIKANVSRYGRQGNIWANIENHEYFRDNISYV